MKEKLQQKPLSVTSPERAAFISVIRKSCVRKMLLAAFSTFVFSLYHFPALAQKSTPLFTVNGDTVTLEEFKYIYEKNNASEKDLYTEKNLKDYLDLYEKFKLKVRAAKDAGLDTSKEFVTEYNQYRSELAQPYLSDREVTQKLIDEAYERMKWEYRVAHILIPVSLDASDKDTLAAYNKAVQLRDSLLKGKDFETMARKYSADPSAARNGGDLGYFTVFGTIYPFESGVYRLTKIGEISAPIRTAYGYHIVKIEDRRPYRGEILVRHILINSAPTDSKEKQQLARNKADSIYNLLTRGGNFADLAKQYSDHTQSRNNGGEMQWFNSFAAFPPDAFKDAAFALKKDGDFTRPVQTQYGWHIIQREQRKDLPTKKEMEEQLRQRIKKDSRSDKSREAAIEKFKQEYGFKESKKALKKFSKMVDTTLLQGTWKAAGHPELTEGSKKDKEMFRLDNKAYRYSDFAAYLQKNEMLGRFRNLDYALKEYYKDFVSQTVYAHQDKNLEKKYPEFRNVAQEYKEGILFFEITDKNVWTKAMQDTVGLKKYYEEHKDKYMWKERAEATIFDVRDQAGVNELKKQLAAGKKSDEIANPMIKKDPLSINYKEGLFERGENKMLDTLKDWKPGVYDLGMQNGRYCVVQVKSIKAPEHKKLNEVKGMVIADYQDSLEKQWLAGLKEKYKVQVNDALVQQMLKNKGK